MPRQGLQKLLHFVLFGFNQGMEFSKLAALFSELTVGFNKHAQACKKRSQELTRVERDPQGRDIRSSQLEVSLIFLTPQSSVIVLDSHSSGPELTRRLPCQIPRVLQTWAGALLYQAPGERGLESVD